MWTVADYAYQTAHGSYVYGDQTDPPPGTTRLYTAAAAAAAAPPGWSLPTVADWQALVNRYPERAVRGADHRRGVGVRCRPDRSATGRRNVREPRRCRLLLGGLEHRTPHPVQWHVAPRLGRGADLWSGRSGGAVCPSSLTSMCR